MSDGPMPQNHPIGASLATARIPAVPVIASPVREQEHAVTLDVLRGAAVLRILFVNVGWFVHPYIQTMEKHSADSITEKTVMQRAQGEYNERI
jgi:uncharacterized membrane protein YeiB